MLVHGTEVWTITKTQTASIGTAGMKFSKSVSRLLKEKPNKNYRN
jgi:hypothetical protein